MDIQILTVQKYNLTDDSCLGGNTYELRSRPHGHFSTACESVGTESGNFRDGRVAKSCLIEKSGLYVYRKHGAGTLSRICAEPIILKTRQHCARANRAGRQGSSLLRSTINNNLISPKCSLLKHIRLSMALPI